MGRRKGKTKPVEGESSEPLDVDDSDLEESGPSEVPNVDCGSGADESPKEGVEMFNADVVDVDEVSLAGEAVKAMVLDDVPVQSLVDQLLSAGVETGETSTGQLDTVEEQREEVERVEPAPFLGTGFMEEVATPQGEREWYGPMLERWGEERAMFIAHFEPVWEDYLVRMPLAEPQTKEIMVELEEELTKMYAEYVESVTLNGLLLASEGWDLWVDVEDLPAKAVWFGEMVCESVVGQVCDELQKLDLWEDYLCELWMFPID